MKIAFGVTGIDNAYWGKTNAINPAIIPLNIGMLILLLSANASHHQTPKA